MNNNINNYSLIKPHTVKYQQANNAKPTFTSNPNIMEQWTDSVSNVVPDYKVSTPMPYTHIEDIKLSDNLTAKYYKLANGQRVVIIPKEGQTVVKTYVNTGSLNEPDNLRGISHYIEHNLFNGSEELGDKVFFDEVNKMGANTNASTSFSQTDYYISSNLLEDSDLEQEIKLHAGMIQSPKFLLEKLEKEKKIVNSEINMSVSEDSNIGFTKTLKNLFGIESSSDDLIAGSTDNISALTRNDVVNYFNNNYYPANMVTVISGEVEPEKTMQLVSKSFTSRKLPTQNRHHEVLTPTQKAVRSDIISKKSDGAASIFLGFAGPENANYQDYMYIRAIKNLANALNNSRFAELERKYSGINVDCERLGTEGKDKCAIVIESKVSEDKVEAFLKDLYSCLNNIITNPPTDSEITAIKKSMKKGFESRMETSYSINHMVGEAFLDGTPEALSEYSKFIENITSEGLVNVAKKYLDLNKAALTVVHPNSVNPNKITENYKKAQNNISFTGANKKTPINTSKITEYKMPNNFNVVLNDTSSENVNFSVSMTEKDWIPKKAAIADILNKMLADGGTKNKSIEQISSLKDLYGITSSLGASSKGLGAFAVFSVDNFEKSLDLFKEQILSPNLSEDNFNRTVKYCKDAYSTFEPSAWSNFDKAMYAGLPIALNAKDKLDSLDSITLDDVKNYYNEIMTNSHGQITISAPFSKHPELKQMVFNNAAQYPIGKPKDISLNKKYKPIEKQQVYLQEHKKNQAQIIEGYRFKRNGNIKDTVCLSLLNEILGGSASSRLFSDLREKRHLAYEVFSDINCNDDMGVVSLCIGTTTQNQETGEKTFDNIEKAINGFNENIQKITTEKVSEDELNAAKKALKNSILSVGETNLEKTQIIDDITNTPYGTDYVNKKFELIDAITADDILNAAKYIFKNPPIYSIGATKDSLEANKSFFDKLSK